MLTAHGLSVESLKQSAENGASYYVPKKELSRIGTFIADVLVAREKSENPWTRCYSRLGGYFDSKFHGPGWREKEKDFWEDRIRHLDLKVGPTRRHGVWSLFLSPCEFEMSYDWEFEP
jgi:hypothetical protein